MRVFLKCKTCGIIFNTWIEVDPLKPLKLEKDEFKCPVGHAHTYTTSDLIFDTGEKKYRRIAGRPIY